MHTKMGQYLVKDFNPALSITKDGTVIYSVEVGELLLNEWGIEVGEKLPSNIEDILQRVLYLNTPEIMEIKVVKRTYMVAFHPSSKEELVNVYAFDKSNQKEFKENLLKMEEHIKFTKTVFAEYRWLYDMLDTLPVMLCLLTSDDHVAFVNRSFRKKYGDPDNRQYYECCFGRTRPSKFCNSFKVLENGVSNNQEVTNTDGSVIDVYNLPFTDVDNSPIILKIKIDITEEKKSEEKLRESEEKYRIIVETANEGIVIIDDKAIITYANGKLADMLGYTVEEGVGLPIWGFIGEEWKDFVKLNMEKRRQGINESYELELMHKDGSPKWVFMSAISLFDNTGKFMGTMSTFTDITKRKEAERALNNIENARKQEIHHRIKNNLQVISSLLDLQAEKFKGKMQINESEVLEAFRESQDRVISMALIHEELYKGRAIDTVNFSHYIRELVDNLFLTYRLGSENISLDMDIEEDIFLDMDTSVPLGIIINELVSNSLKHAFYGRENGEIKINLHKEKCKIEDCKSTAFILSVSDNGIGIPQDLDIKDIDSLGLQLVTTLVDQLDGELELKSNNGAEFIIRFTVM